MDFPTETTCRVFDAVHLTFGGGIVFVHQRCNGLLRGHDLIHYREPLSFQLDVERRSAGR
jgi:hypothetical protein